MTRKAAEKPATSGSTPGKTEEAIMLLARVRALWAGESTENSEAILEDINRVLGGVPATEGPDGVR